MAENNFNKNLSVFFMENREAALSELYQHNANYRKLRENLQEISKRAKEIPVGYTGIIDSLTDALLAVARAEANYLYLRGFKDCVKLYKRLDDTFDESREFEGYIM